MGSLSAVTDGIFGSSSDPGLLGLGKYGGNKAYNIDPNAFNVNGLNSYSQEQNSRAQQSSLAQALAQQMNGMGPSLAQGQLRQATDRNIAQQMGAASSARGVNPAFAQRLAAQNIAQTNQQAAGDASQLRMQEMMNAQNQLSSVLGAQRQGDLVATDRDLSAGMAKENLGVQQQTGLNSVNQAAYDSAGKRRSEMVSNLGGAGIALLSDRNNKTEIGSGEGKYFSPMAQEIEKTEVGKSMVRNSPDGKTVDYQRGLGAMLASQAMLNKKIKKLERKL